MVPTKRKPWGGVKFNIIDPELIQMIHTRLPIYPIRRVRHHGVHFSQCRKNFPAVAEVKSCGSYRFNPAHLSTFPSAFNPQRRFCTSSEPISRRGQFSTTTPYTMRLMAEPIS